MPSYTSNSKFKKLIWLLIILFIAGFIVENILVEYLVKRKSSVNTYLDHIDSKYIHMRLNLQGLSHRDIIFVGNSRTLFQINTYYLSQHGFPSYNYGVSGRLLLDLPSMVHNAIKFNPKIIVIPIDITQFYVKKLMPQTDIDYLDILFEIKSHFSIGLILRSLIMANEHAFPLQTYATTLNEKIRIFYQHISSHKGKKSRHESHASKHVSKKKITTIRGCVIFKSIETVNKVHVLYCENGDGVLVGSDLKHIRQYVPVDLKKGARLNLHAVEYMNTILKTIRRHGIMPIIILTPILHAHYHKRFMSHLVYKLHAKKLNLTDMKLRDDNWANIPHLNMVGRQMLTLHFMRWLKSMSLYHDAHS